MFIYPCEELGDYRFGNYEQIWRLEKTKIFDFKDRNLNRIKKDKENMLHRIWQSRITRIWYSRKVNEEDNEDRNHVFCVPDKVVEDMIFLKPYR